MKMEIDVLSVGRALAIAASVATVIALLLLAWIGGELHNQSCIQSAEARYPANDRQARSEAIDNCSRWP